MKVLLLSCNTGEGHNSAARAVSEALTERGAECTLLDALSLRGSHNSRIASKVYCGVTLTAPRLFGALYGVAGVISHPGGHSPVYLANCLNADRLYAYLLAGGFDAAVCSHLFPAETLTRVRRKHTLPLKTFFVATDYTCSPFNEETALDYYFLPHRALELEYRIPPEKRIVTGIPVGRGVTALPDKATCRRELQLPEAQTLYLIMTGSMGFGQVETLISQLLPRIADTARILVLCGRNDSLRHTLSERFSGQVAPMGYTRRAGMYLRACDAVFTKPGGLTSTEAAVTGVPLIHMPPIPGCETKNAAFFRKTGMSLSYDGSAAAVDSVLQTLADPVATGTMLQAQRDTCPADAADRIAAFVLEQTGATR